MGGLVALSSRIVEVSEEAKFIEEEKLEIEEENRELREVNDKLKAENRRLDLKIYTTGRLICPLQEDVERLKEIIRVGGFNLESDAELIAENDALIKECDEIGAEVDDGKLNELIKEAKAAL